MSANAILLPVLVQISLTLVMFLLLGARKTKAMKAGGVDSKATALNNSAWPEDVVKVSNNIANQFQTPVLFYIISILFYLTNQVSLTVLVLAWIYSGTRVIHAFIHAGSNFVPARFIIFTLGVICLIAMTVIAFIKMPISL